MIKRIVNLNKYNLVKSPFTPLIIFFLTFFSEYVTTNTDAQTLLLDSIENKEIVQKNRFEIESFILEAAEDYLSNNIDSNQNHQALDISVLSYYLEEKFPGFCGINSPEERLSFLKAPTIIRFQKGGFEKYVSNHCNTLILIKPNLKLFIVFRGKEQLSWTQISRNFWYLETRSSGNSADFLAQARRIVSEIESGK